MLHSKMALKVYKITVKFLNNLGFGVDFKVKVPPLMYKISTHNINGVRNYIVTLHTIMYVNLI